MAPLSDAQLALKNMTEKENTSSLIVMSYHQARAILDARHQARASVRVSLDLEMTHTELALHPEGVALPSGEIVRWAVIGQIVDRENTCFRVDGGEAHAIQSYSHIYDRAYSLYPTEYAPTMLVSGKPMHRIKGTDPHRDTLSKMAAIGHASGFVLDTCTGLGYTASEAAKTAALVTTIELDPAAQEIARQNPWSQGLFNNNRIVQIIGDTAEIIIGIETASYNLIIHDPPMFSLGGELYSLDFYHEAYRVLKPRGKMFHYIGNPDSASGATVTKGVMKRLSQAGFHTIIPKPAAFGVLAAR